MAFFTFCRIYFTMFATIKTVSEPENFWKKVKYNLMPPPIQSEVVHVDGGSDFLKLTVPIVRGKIYWNHVQSVAGAAAGNLLMTKDITIHEQAQLRAFRSDKLSELVTINSFFKLLSLLPGGILEKECAVIDYPGTLAKNLRLLPRRCRTVRIITANAVKYKALSEESLAQYGCALQIGNDITKAFDATVILMPHRAQIPTAFSAQSLVFAAFRENLYTARLITPEGISLPEKYLSLMPGGISPLQFAGALYELSGVSALKDSVCPAFRLQNQILSYKDVISMLD